MEEFINNNWWWFVLLMIWASAWKGFALWHAARNKDKAWFVAILIINSVGLLEMFYLFIFSGRQKDKKN